MAARPTWKGYLKVSLVSVPVKAYTIADSAHKDIQLNQLHESCHSRIRYQKTCPVHGEVSQDEIIMGYRIANDQYVAIDPDELNAIRPKSDQSIEINAFFGADQLDERFLTDRSYYLVPDGKVAQKPYQLIRQTLDNDELRAIAEVVISKREHHVLVRPLGKLLIMTVLQHETELKATREFEDEVDEMEFKPQEVQLTQQLIGALTQEELDFSTYSDEYEQRLSELIAAKVEGKELVRPPAAEAPAVINLVDALKASLKQIPVPRAAASRKSTRSTAAKQKPARKPSPSVSQSAAKRKSKRKTG